MMYHLLPWKVYTSPLNFKSKEGDMTRMITAHHYIYYYNNKMSLSNIIFVFLTTVISPCKYIVFSVMVLVNPNKR